MGMTKKQKEDLRDYVFTTIDTGLGIAAITGAPALQVLACLPAVVEKAVTVFSGDTLIVKELRAQLDDCVSKSGKAYLKEMEKQKSHYYEFCNFAWPSTEFFLKEIDSTEKLEKKYATVLSNEKRLEGYEITNLDIEKIAKEFIRYFYFYLGEYPNLSSVLVNSRIAKLEKDDKKIVEENTIENKSIKYIKRNDLLGRDKEVKKIQELIMEFPIVNVHGIPGIGKSSVCFYSLQDYNNKDKYLLREISARGCNEYESFLSKLLQAFGCKQEKNAEIKLEEKICKHSEWQTVIIYIDNFEDCLGDKRIIRFLNQLTSLNNGIRILLSSREIIGGVKNYNLKFLPNKIAIDLFKMKVSLVNPTLKIEDSKIENFILKKLNSHTGSIVLVASNCDGFNSLDEIIEIWDNQREMLLEASGINDESLTTSLSYSYRRIKDDRLAISIWSCFALFPEELNEETICLLYPEFENECKRTIHELRRHELIFQDENGYSMLQPIRDRIFWLAKENELIINGKSAIDRVLKYYLNNKYFINSRYDELIYTMRFIEQHGFCVVNEQDYNDIINAILPVAKRHPYVSIPFLKIISKRIKVDYYLAETYHYLGDNSQAFSYYNSALLCKENLTKEMLARIYCMECEIKRLEKKRDEALNLAKLSQEEAKRIGDIKLEIASYWQEGEIYRLIDKNMEKALQFFLEISRIQHFYMGESKAYDIIWSIGEIYRVTGKKRLARERISQALEGYIQMKNLIGMGYAYLSIASLNINLKKSNSLEMCAKAYNTFFQANFELGCGHSLKWKGKYYLDTNPEKAESLLNHALEKYNKAGYTDGITEISNLLKSKM